MYISCNPVLQVDIQASYSKIILSGGKNSGQSNCKGIKAATEEYNSASSWR